MSALKVDYVVCQSSPFISAAFIRASKRMLSKSLVTATTKPILLSILAEREDYGYRILQRVEEISDGKISWTTGVLYPALHSLENGGLVASRWREVENAPDRKYYRLTAAGRKELASEKRQWLDVNAVFAKLWGPELGLG